MGIRGGSNVVEIVIKAKDAASGVITNTMRTLDHASNAYVGTLNRISGAASTAGVKLAGMIAAASGIRAITSEFRNAINNIDEYNKAVISVAATVTEMAENANGNLKSIYDANLAWALDTYKKIELEAAKHFASGKEMIEGWQILTQKGLIVSSDKDIANLGIIVDRIKLATSGQNSQIQIAQ